MARVSARYPRGRHAPGDVPSVIALVLHDNVYGRRLDSRIGLMVPHVGGAAVGVRQHERVGHALDARERERARRLLVKLLVLALATDEYARVQRPAVATLSGMAGIVQGHGAFTAGIGSSGITLPALNRRRQSMARLRLSARVAATSGRQWSVAYSISRDV